MTDLAHFATWREILAQPAIWRGWAQELDVRAHRAWVEAQACDEIWLCGAGSSAYIGEMIVAALEGSTGPRLRAVATTDLVARPHAYLRNRRPLVISFGRSGNSAETIGTLDALDALAPDAPRLNITCNANSALATRTARHQRVIALPAATHDAGFAMTSSFTTMALTALAILDRGCAEGAVSARIETLCQSVEHLLPALASRMARAAIPERAVFVGSGPLAFAAREAALKVMELSAGMIPALWDSSLGFRHGPKSFVRGQTGIWVFAADDPDTRRYDLDLAQELRQQFPAAQTVVVGPGGDVDMPTGGWAVLLPVVLAQVMAVHWSNRLGLPVDDPFAGQGTLSRVVSGVRLYPVRAA